MLSHQPLQNTIRNELSRRARRAAQQIGQPVERAAELRSRDARALALSRPLLLLVAERLRRHQRRVPTDAGGRPRRAGTRAISTWVQVAGSSSRRARA